MKKFYLTNTDHFKRYVTIKDCLHPESLKNVEIVNEEYNTKGELLNTSTYQFMLTVDEINVFRENLTV
jgi:hypothetical protein